MKISAERLLIMIPLQFHEFLKLAVFQVAKDVLSPSLLCLCEYACRLIESLRLRFAPSFGALSVALFFVVNRNQVLKYVQWQSKAAQLVV